MNFLAHALLAGDDPALIVGGVAGDWIKGTLPAGLPHDLARGVALHRAIDSHADAHPSFQQSRTRVSAARRRYAGVLVDMFYDHLLARAWGELHHQPLKSFCADVYGLVEQRLSELPSAAHGALRMMAREDWLSSYAEVAGLADVLARMSRRTRQPNPLSGGEQELLVDVAGFARDFECWLADAQAYSLRWQAERSGRMAPF